MCFISMNLISLNFVARNLSMKIPQPAENLANDEKGKDHMDVARGEEFAAEGIEELAVIDYTPARKKSPIHN